MQTDGNVWPVIIFVTGVMTLGLISKNQPRTDRAGIRIPKLIEYPVRP